MKFRNITSVEEEAISIIFSGIHKRLPDLKCPKTFSEKLQYRKLHDRDSRLPRLSDKVLAKLHVAEVLGENWIIPTIWSGQVLPPREERNWPIPYVLKANHGCGWNLFIKSPEEQDWERIEKITTEWLQQTYGVDLCEWLYSQITPQLLVEPCIGIGNDIFPIDYKIMVFNGYAPYIFMVSDRATSARCSVYNRNWELQSVSLSSYGVPRLIPRPRSLDQMLWAAELLGKDFSSVRVDFYEVNDTPLFGEMTFYHASGFQAYNPETFDRLLGSFWDYPRQ